MVFIFTCTVNNILHTPWEIWNEYVYDFSFLNKSTLLKFCLVVQLNDFVISMTRKSLQALSMQTRYNAWSGCCYFLQVNLPDDLGIKLCSWDRWSLLMPWATIFQMSSFKQNYYLVIMRVMHHRLFYVSKFYIFRTGMTAKSNSDHKQ